jgi:hypothetical protein
VKRKRSKARPKGTACIAGRRCIATHTFYDARNDRELRYCDKHMADRLMADHVKAEERCCRFCGSGVDLQWCHVHSRRYMAIRWERENSMALCRTHHMMFTVNPLKWEQWCRDVGIDWDGLRVKALKNPAMQPMFVIERLREVA